MQNIPNESTTPERTSPTASARRVSIAREVSLHGSIAPDIQITPASPTGSNLSFEPAPADMGRWELKPYNFNCPLLPDDGAKDFSELASIKLPDYHLLVDHSLGVAWKCFSNGRRDVGELRPDQVLWAQKLTEAHNQGQRSRYSEYLSEVCMSLYASGMKIMSAELPRRPQLPKPEGLIESSFILTNMRSADESVMIPAAASTPLPGYDLPPMVIPAIQREPPTPIRTTSPASSPRATPRTSSTDPREVLIRNLENIHQMLIRWKQNQLKTLENEMGHLENMKKILHSLTELPQS